MASSVSLDLYKQILAHLLCDVQTSLSQVITPTAYRLTIAKINKRCAAEGFGFLTKTLPRLGKALDKALSDNAPLSASDHRLATLKGSQLPKLFGELFQRVLSSDGRCLQSPCVISIKALRQLLFVYYKLELPYAPELEQQVIDQFLETERDIVSYDQEFSRMADLIDSSSFAAAWHLLGDRASTIRRARKLLARVFASFDASDIVPRHGPGAVSTGERLWDKYRFVRYNARICRHYPFDAFYCASPGHVCDTYPSFEGLADVESFARVILVPKDSRGPRLISCEPLCFQWIQQGLGAAIVRQVESSRVTRFNVHFTDQRPNQIGALLGSRSGKYSTLDLKDASDRVTVGLVRLLFPQHIANVLLDCRTLATVLPNGRIQKLSEFAPMGSSLCFPVLALTVWAILTASSTDADARESVLVYGDDVIVRTDNSGNAMKQLESFGLAINRDKSCYQGSFRESCGMDAFKGIDVTPIRLKDCWSLSPCASSYMSYLSFSNNLYMKGYYIASEFIAGLVCSLYREVPTADMNLSCPSLCSVPRGYRMPRRRVNRNLQRLEWRVLDVHSPVIRHEMDGWLMLLRWFTEGAKAAIHLHGTSKSRCIEVGSMGSYFSPNDPFSASLYTRRDTSHLVFRWRGV